MKIKVHDPDRCQGQYCVVHNPSDHHMIGWPLKHRIDRTVELAFRITYTLTERICAHGVGHPDPDSVAYARALGGDEFADAEAVHGCDGCCNPEHGQQDDLDWVFTERWHFLPDDDPRVVEMRERFFAVLDAHEQGEAGGSNG